MPPAAKYLIVGKSRALVKLGMVLRNEKGGKEMLGAQLLNWGVARRYSEARCTWVQPSRNDRPSEEEVRNRERIHHNFHLLLRAACSVLLHPNPSAHLIVRLLQWAQSTGFVPCSSFLVPSCRPGRATQATALPNVAHCPASRLLQQTIDSSSVCHLPPPCSLFPRCCRYAQV